MSAPPPPTPPPPLPSGGSMPSLRRFLPRPPPGPPPSSSKGSKSKAAHGEEVETAAAADALAAAFGGAFSAEDDDDKHAEQEQEDRTLPRLPSAEPPERSAAEMEEDARQFELAKAKLKREREMQEAKAKQLKESKKPSMLFLPRLPSAAPPERSAAEREEDIKQFELAKAKLAREKELQKEGRSTVMRAILPHLPSMPPPPKTLDELAKEEEEFDRITHRMPSPKKSMMSFRNYVTRQESMRYPPRSPAEIAADEAEELERNNEEGMRLEMEEAEAIRQEAQRIQMQKMEEEKDQMDEEEAMLKRGVEKNDRSCRAYCLRNSYRNRRDFGREVRERHAMERILMCGFAVALLWLTSLRDARALVATFIIGPALTSVINSVEIAVNTTTEERSRYASCTSRRVAYCNQTFTLQLDAEVDRSTRVIIDNQILLDNYTTTYTEAAANFQYSIQIIDYLENNLGKSIYDYATPGFNETAICTQITTLVAQQTAAKASQSTAQTFQQQANNTMNAIANQIYARQGYDFSYLTMKMGDLDSIGTNLNGQVEDPADIFAPVEVAQNKMTACTVQGSTYAGEKCANPSLMDSITNVKNTIGNDYLQDYQQIQNWITTTTNDFLPLKNFFDAFTSQVIKYSNLIEAIGAALEPHGGSVAALDYDPNLDTNLGNIDATAPSVQNTTFNVNPIGTSTSLQAANGSTTLADQQAAATENADKIKQAQTAWQASFFDDYNPPPVDTNTTIANWNQYSNTFIPNISLNAGLIAARINTPQPPEVDLTANFSQSIDTAIQLIETLDPRNLEFFVYDNIDIAYIEAELHALENLALNFDSIYRAVRTLQVIRKYWRVSDVATPPVDVRGSLNKGKATTQAAPYDPIQSGLTLLTSPVVMFAMFTVFGVFLFSAFLVLYLPIYAEYTAGCVLGNFLGNGTVITRDGYTVAFQYGSSEGDALADSEIDRLNVARELECEKNIQATYQAQVDDLSAYNNIVNKMVNLQGNNSAFQICIDTAKIDEIVPNIAIAATGGNATSMHGTVFNESLAAHFAPITLSLFDCDAISLCEVDCTGPNAEVISSSVFNAGCTVEWYLHASLLGFLLSLFVFVLTNVSRDILLRGVVHVFWRNIAVAKFTYIGSCYDNGDLIFPKEVTKGLKTFKQTIKDGLKVSLHKLERMGYCMLIAALLLNVPWVVLLYVLSKDLVFVATNTN